jgi:RNase P/RNase MRP subunit p29
LKTVTKAIAEDTAVFNFAVKKGAKKVTVTIDGKAYAASVNVK